MWPTLAPARPEFTLPNAITKADFDGWAADILT